MVQVNGKYCAFWLADYVFECCEAGVGPVHNHGALQLLNAPVVAMLGLCSDLDLQHLHTALSVGAGGVRQVALGQLRDEHARVKYKGRV